MKVLIYEGGENLPTFINSLINQLLLNGMEVSLVGKNKCSYTPKNYLKFKE